MLICKQKINYITHFFINMLQRNIKCVILGNWCVPGHTHLKWCYYFEEIFNICQQAKNQLPSFTFSLKYCNDNQKKTSRRLECMETSCGRLQCIQKINFIIHFFLKILHFKESFNLIGWLGHNSGPRILPDIVVKYQ